MALLVHLASGACGRSSKWAPGPPSRPPWPTGQPSGLSPTSDVGSGLISRGEGQKELAYAKDGAMRLTSSPQEKEPLRSQSAPRAAQPPPPEAAESALGPASLLQQRKLRTGRGPSSHPEMLIQGSGSCWGAWNLHSWPALLGFRGQWLLSDHRLQHRARKEDPTGSDGRSEQSREPDPWPLRRTPDRPGGAQEGVTVMGLSSWVCDLCHHTGPWVRATLHCCCFVMCSDF